MFRRLKCSPFRQGHRLRLEPLEDRLLMSGLTNPLRMGPEPAPAVPGAAATRQSSDDDDTYSAGQSQGTAADHPPPQPPAAQGLPGQTPSPSGNNSSDSAYAYPPAPDDKAYYRTPAVPPAAAAATPADVELPHTTTPPAPGTTVVPAALGGTPPAPAVTPRVTLPTTATIADHAQAAPTLTATAHYQPAEDAGAIPAGEAVPALTEATANPPASPPAPDWRAALPSLLPLPLDLPPPDFGAWAGAAERFFLELDALTRDGDGESVWTNLTPWCVALGALSVSLEFTRRWLGQRAADLADETPRGWSWRWSRGDGPRPPEQP